MIVVTNENVNGIVDYSVAMVDSIIKDREYPGKLKISLYLAFISYIIEYGYDKIETIYKTFSSTRFTMTQLTIADYIQSRSDFREDKKNVHGNVLSQAPAVTVSLLEGDIHSPIFIDEIAISSKADMDILCWIEALIHEINHLYNSQNNRLQIWGEIIVIRNGLQTHQYGFGKDIEKGRTFDECINSLQTEKLVQNIIELHGLHIKNPFITSMLENTKYGANKKYISTGYQAFLPLYREAYCNKHFAELLSNGLNQGNITFISSEFDKCAGNGSYNQLLGLSDRLFDTFIINQHDPIFEGTAFEIRMILKKYLQNVNTKKY